MFFSHLQTKQYHNVLTGWKQNMKKNYQAATDISNLVDLKITTFKDNFEKLKVPLKATLFAYAHKDTLKYNSV